MGGFYGSVQVRSGDRDAVRGVAERVAGAMGIRLLMGPAIDGWVGLYPENSGQDQRVGEEVARLIDGYVLHLLVHDDDIFAYWLYHDRQPIDSYNSAPGYFGDENLAGEEKRVENPEAFRPLIADRAIVLGKLLAEERPTFESERLAEFAKLLGISNAVQAYEYLREEGHGGVKGWRKFEEIPAGSVEAEQGHARKEKAQLKADLKKLKADGMLLIRDERKQRVAFGCSCGDGFFVAWPDPFKQTVEYFSYRQPWDAGEAVPLETPAYVSALASDSAGGRTVIAAGNRLQIWDSLSSGAKRVADIPECEFIMGVSISADGKCVAHVSGKEIVVSDASDGRRLLAVPVETHRQVAIHPSEEWVAAAGNTLGLISVNEDPRWRDLFIGGRSALADGVQVLLRSNMKAINLDDLDKQHHVAMKEGEAMLRKMAKQLKPEEPGWAVAFLRHGYGASGLRMGAGELASGVVRRG